MSADKQSLPPADHSTTGHIVPPRTLGAVCVALLAFTGLTVWLSYFHLGNWNLWAALGIATVKAGLVVLFFMHLKYDRPFNAVLILAALLFVLLFVGFTLIDTTHYRDQLYPVDSPQYAPRIESQRQRG